jgi:dihydroneopterin aldolase
MFATLKLKDLILAVRLGCGEVERAQPQEVRVSVEFRFKKNITSIKSDNIDETVCYAKAAAAIREHCESREFKLIERLGFEIYEVMGRVLSESRSLHEPVEVAVTVHKVHPPVERLEGGSWFSYGDFQT